MVIGQLRRINQEPWSDVPFLDEIPFFSMQNRMVMELCGIIDPFSLGEYIANGGYRAFLKTIRSLYLSVRFVIWCMKAG